MDGRTFDGIFLTAQDIRIVEMLVEGKCYKEIAWELHISYSAMRQYRVQNVWKKLGLKSRHDLLIWGVLNLAAGAKGQ